MAPQKTRALLLHMLPYRESSSILRLYSEDLGMVHGIARGVRRGSRESVPLERGMVLELTVYVRPHRTLQTLAAPAVAEFFPGLRTDLRRTAVRDAAFEFVLKAVHPEDPHPELYRFLHGFVGALECAPASAVLPCSLWAFLVRFAELLGVGLDLRRCVRCGRDLAPADDTVLLTEEGGLACAGCVRGGRPEALMPAAVRACLSRAEPSAPPGGMGATEQRRITRLLAAHCRRHLEIDGDLRALDFACELTDSAGGAPR